MSSPHTTKFLRTNFFLNETIFTTPVKIIKNPFVLVKMQDIHTQEQTACYSFLFWYIEVLLQVTVNSGLNLLKGSFIYHCTKMKQTSLNINQWFVWVRDNLMGIVREFPNCVSFRNTKHVRGVPLGALPPPPNITI